MSRRNPLKRATRPTGPVAAFAAATAVLLTATGLPAGAEDEISIEPDRVIVAPPGSVTTVATEVVPAGLVGSDCDLKVVTVNGASVHAGNVVIATTGDSVTTVDGVEDAADGSVVGTARVTLGDQIVVELRMGPDGISSLGFTVSFDCPPSAPVVAPGVQTSVVTPPAAPVSATPPTPGTGPPVVAGSTAVPPPTVLPAVQEALPPTPTAAATVAAPAYTG
ncbi:MAG: hypothetical protein ACFCVK_24985 [Acidimicrobiales bacterium]